MIYYEHRAAARNLPHQIEMSMIYATKIGYLVIQASKIHDLNWQYPKYDSQPKYSQLFSSHPISP
jgi:hypothetical protein